MAASSSSSWTSTGSKTSAPSPEAIQGQSERAIRDRIAALPDGTYEGAINIEGIDDPLRLACRAEIASSGISLDFAGTSSPVNRGINVPLCYTRAFACYAVKCLTVPGMPNNEGAVAPIRVSAPEDCILNAQPPYPTGGRHVTGHMIVPLVFRTLAEAAPEQVQADCGNMNIVTFQGTRPDGEPMSTIYFSTGGFGALEEFDGADTIPGPSNMRAVPVEMWESLTGITITHKRLLPDTGGHGEARGGLGQEIEFRNETGFPLTAFCIAPRSEFPARGLFGGGDGSLRSMLVDGCPVHPKGAHVVAPGQRFTMRDSGGGGFGDPANRPRAKILADVDEGLITPRTAGRSTESRRGSDSGRNGGVRR